MIVSAMYCTQLAALGIRSITTDKVRLSRLIRVGRIAPHGSTPGKQHATRGSPSFDRRKTVFASMGLAKHTEAEQWLRRARPEDAAEPSHDAWLETDIGHLKLHGARFRALIAYIPVSTGDYPSVAVGQD